MATWYLINSTRFKGPAGPTLITAGELVDDTKTPLAPLQASGALFAPSSSPAVAVAAAFVQQRVKRGGQDPMEATAIMMAAYLQDTIGSGSVVQRLEIDVPLATLQAKTSGTEFNIGAVLPPNCRVVSQELNVVAALAGGTVSAAEVQLEQATKTAGEFGGGSSGYDGFTAAGVFSIAGSNPYASRGGQQLAMKVTLTGDTMAHLTAGHLKVEVYYSTTT
jgi:hypothetical protein